MKDIRQAPDREPDEQGGAPMEGRWPEFALRFAIGVFCCSIAAVLIGGGDVLRNAALFNAVNVLLWAIKYLAMQRGRWTR